MKKFILLIVLFISLFACSKDKFQTAPQITISNYNSKNISDGGTLLVRLNYNDKEGDIGGGAYFIDRVRLNQKPLSVVDNDLADTIISTIPQMPNTDKGQLVISLDYSFLKESTTENDTMVFKIAITDVAGHKSDTLTTDKIVAIKK